MSILKKTAIMSVLFLTLTAGMCKHTEDVGAAKPVQVPELPTYFKEKAERLPEITDPTFGGIMLDSADTDIKYNGVAIRYNQFVDFYECIRVSVNEKKDPKDCLNKILE